MGCLSWIIYIYARVGREDMSFALLFELSVYALITGGAVLLIASSVWDGKHRRARHAGANRSAAHATVLMYARNSETTVESSLQSIAASMSGSYDIVIVDDKSLDDTRRVVRAYRQSHPDILLRLYARRCGGGRVTALREAFRYSMRGDIVLIVDADSDIEVVVADSLSIFSEDMTIQAMYFAMVGSRTTQLGSMVQYFIDQSQLQYMKTRSLLIREARGFGENGCAYRVHVQGRRRLLPVVASAQLRPGVVTRKMGGLELSRRPSLRVYDWLNVIAAGWMLGLGIWLAYGAAMQQVSQPLIITWLIIAAWLVVISITDEYIGLVQKMGYVIYAPAFSIILYVYWILQSIAALLLALFSKRLRY